MKSSWEKMRRTSRIFCTLVTHSIPTMARARMPTRLTLPISRTSWILGNIRGERSRPDVADDAVEVRSKLIDHVEETLAKADDVPGHPSNRLIESF